MPYFEIANQMYDIDKQTGKQCLKQQTLVYMFHKNCNDEIIFCVLKLTKGALMQIRKSPYMFVFI